MSVDPLEEEFPAWTPTSLIYNGMEVLHPNGALEDYGEALATYRKGNTGAVFKLEL